MSARASGYVKGLTMCPNGELISAREKLVAMVLADSHQDRARRFTFPSVDTIAEEARCDRRSCQRFLSALERKGVIRRLRPSRQGSGMHVYYFFTVLDEIPEGWQDAALFEQPRAEGRAAKGRVKGREKGGNFAPCSNGARAGTVTEATGATSANTPPSLCEGAGAELETDETNSTKGAETPAATPAECGAAAKPVQAVATANVRTGDRARDAGRNGRSEPAAAGPAVEHAIDQVMQACGFAARRLRKPLRAVIELEADKGEAPATAALAMIAAWKELQAQGTRLRWRWGPKAFFEEGHWKNSGAWPWDPDALAMDRLRASQGVTNWTQ